MENSKYYTPSIEEFHIGFEYEVIKPHVDWVKLKLDSENYYMNIDRVINLGETIRVKSLDKEDIESLGIWEESELEYQPAWLEEPKYEYYHNNNILRLRHYENGIVHIHNTRGVAINKYDTFFSGIIKNKSELIKLMKQLGI